ncbi:hypothetical protein Pmar_PMAR023400 [Perkinsus marinus ATCC 50983]|uniref:Uncharacterized protein n=1 Tax=Perkinsus marinus (strain ATCC 50983 / TXsc) TaxID=423536 RepID=C5KKG3_PERM5|nr:hypothetical protein Pmar_PMAR023400 [Perkinsus marinus ATCC 50983]EER15075.1 hypothetical protein Pmar_PMAR023400 [Perkinsus marinus ATCC 50983]|eukprot:XP_002783279.1 hypothetical protein Pmar_PMAR023400 [Perkinsus marinus ATCC 50983]
MNADADSPRNSLELRQEDLPSGGTMADALLEREREFKPFVRFYDTATYNAVIRATVSTQTDDEGTEDRDTDGWFNGVPQSPVRQPKRRRYTPPVEASEAVVASPQQPDAEASTNDEDGEVTVSQREVAAHEYTDVLEEELIIDEADLVPEDSTEEFIVVQDDMGRDRRVRPDSETYKRYRRISATRRANEQVAADSEEQSAVVTTVVESPQEKGEDRPEARQAEAGRGVIAYDDL